MNPNNNGNNINKRIIKNSELHYINGKRVGVRPYVKMKDPTFQVKRATRLDEPIKVRINRWTQEISINNPKTNVRRVIRVRPINNNNQRKPSQPPKKRAKSLNTGRKVIRRTEPNNNKINSKSVVRSKSVKVPQRKKSNSIRKRANVKPIKRRVTKPIERTAVNGSRRTNKSIRSTKSTNNSISVTSRLGESKPIVRRDLEYKVPKKREPSKEYRNLNVIRRTVNDRYTTVRNVEEECTSCAKPKCGCCCRPTPPKPEPKPIIRLEEEINHCATGRKFRLTQESDWYLYKLIERLNCKVNWIGSNMVEAMETIETTTTMPEEMVEEVTAVVNNFQTLNTQFTSLSTTVTQLRTEIKEMTTINNVNEDCICRTGQTFTDPDEQDEITITESGIIYITMIGGGGSGGMGYISGMTYYAGGGGGSGSYIIKFPVEVEPTWVIRITVGMGGILSVCADGQPSIVEILEDGVVIRTIMVMGGMAGNPKLESETAINGGNGGDSTLVSTYNGNPGEDGMLGLPSVVNVYGGNGGNSPFGQGGTGGGKTTGEFEFTGSHGTFGAGGGGGIPIIDPIEGQELGGNGGTGFVLIEYA